MTFLATVGKDIKAVFAWLGSSKAQTIINAGEEAAEALGVPAAIINIGNYWLGKIITIESVAAAAGQQAGSGTTKAAAVLADVTPYVLQVAQQNGLPAPTSADIAKANDALVAFLNALGANTPAPAVVS